MHRSKRIPSWLTYLALVLAAHVVHACALKSDTPSPNTRPPLAKRHT